MVLGMKAQWGVDAGTGYVHTVTATPANVHDLDQQQIHPQHRLDRLRPTTDLARPVLEVERLDHRDPTQPRELTRIACHATPGGIRTSA